MLVDPDWLSAAQFKRLMGRILTAVQRGQPIDTESSHDAAEVTKRMDF